MDTNRFTHSSDHLTDFESVKEDGSFVEKNKENGKKEKGGNGSDDDILPDEEQNDEEVVISSSSDNDEDAMSQEMEEKTEGVKYWIPKVAAELTPRIGLDFVNDKKAEEFYKNYAEKAGFKVRLSNKKFNRLGRLTTRYFLCNKQGVPTSKTYDSMITKHHNTNYNRSGCKARLKIHFVKERNRYEIFEFTEWHNHMMKTQDEMRFSRPRKKQLMNTQIGVTKGHRIRNKRNSAINVSRGTVRNKDAQMLINTMESRRKVCPDYFFEYKCDEKELEAIFWADENARLNYKEFGDALSFDGTYQTKHEMIFVPFVSIDNHKNTVVVGAALIRSETVVNFTWVLNAFMKAHGRQPKFVMTDQCVAIKQAIAIVFPNSRHRLCMWHITKKIEKKISRHLKNNTSFISELNKLVSNVNLDPDVFEVKWKELMDRYELNGDPWFEEMYSIRESWIPAYYKDFQMSGLMKTTSRSESVNAFFKVYAASWQDLNEFLDSFDIAIETQREKHAAEEIKNKSTYPRMISPTLIEEHASVMYTRTIFFEVQKEISKAVWSCSLKGIKEVDGNKVFTITNEKKASEVKATYTVVHNRSNDTIDCSCNYFVRNGILCRHAFMVILSGRYNRIPDKYIMRRWQRDLVPVEWLPASVRYKEVDIEKQKLLDKAYSLMESIIDHIRNDKNALKSFVNFLEEWNSNINNELPAESSRFGASRPDVDILPPSGIRNKGCGTGKRLIGVREKDVTDANKKPKRVCRKCGKLARHDSRNCPESRKFEKNQQFE